MSEITEARLERWWRTGPPLSTIEEAREYVDDVGISLLFGGAAARYPSLREASRDESLPRLPSGWADDIEAMWAWKDTLPLEGRTWLGRYLSGRQTLLSPQLLADLYEFAGEDDDAVCAPGLSEDARRLASLLLDNGPMTTRTLRTTLGVTGKKFNLT